MTSSDLQYVYITSAYFPTVSLESVHFPGVFVRLDGGKVKQYEHEGSGVEFGNGPYELFKMEPHPANDGS